MKFIRCRCRLKILRPDMALSKGLLLEGLLDFGHMRRGVWCCVANGECVRRATTSYNQLQSLQIPPLHHITPNIVIVFIRRYYSLYG